MIRLEDLQPNASIRDILPDILVTVVSVHWFGSEALELTYKTPTGKVANELLYRHDEERLELVEHGRPRSFDGNGALFRLVSEAHHIRLANLFDPVLQDYFRFTISQLSLPTGAEHMRVAVYIELPVPAGLAICGESGVGLRQKTLVRESGGYLQGKCCFRVFHSEVVQADDSYAWIECDCTAILKVTELLPETVLQEDQQLLMYVHNAAHRQQEQSKQMQLI